MKRKKIAISIVPAVILYILIAVSGCMFDDLFNGDSSSNSNESLSNTIQETRPHIALKIDTFNDVAGGAIELELAIPSEFIIESNADGNLSANGFNAAVSDSIYNASYISSSRGDKGEFRLSFICSTGFGSGDIGALIAELSSGSDSSSIEQIDINLFKVMDLNGVEIGGEVSFSYSP